MAVRAEEGMEASKVEARAARAARGALAATRAGGEFLAVAAAKAGVA